MTLGFPTRLVQPDVGGSRSAGGLHELLHFSLLLRQQQCCDLQFLFSRLIQILDIFFFKNSSFHFLNFFWLILPSARYPFICIRL